MRKVYLILLIAIFFMLTQIRIGTPKVLANGKINAHASIDESEHVFGNQVGFKNHEKDEINEKHKNNIHIKIDRDDDEDEDLAPTPTLTPTVTPTVTPTLTPTPTVDITPTVSPTPEGTQSASIETSSNTNLSDNFSFEKWIHNLERFLASIKNALLGA